MINGKQECFYSVNSEQIFLRNKYAYKLFSLSSCQFCFNFPLLSRRLKQGKPIIPEILTRCIPGKGGKGSKAADSSKKASPSGYGDSDDDDDPFGSDDEEQLFLSPKKTQKVGSYRQPAGPRRSDKKKSRDEDEEDMWDSW